MGKKYLEKKENGQIKGLLSSIYGWFFNTRYNLLYQMFVPNFKILGQVVAEKSLTKKVYTHKNTRKKEKLYTPYILRIPGV